MTRCFLAPAAAKDLVEIWHFIRKESSEETAKRVEAEIRQKMTTLANTPGIGHRRRDLTLEDVRFYRVYSYLIVYRANVKPLQIVGVLHGARDLEFLLRNRV